VVGPTLGQAQSETKLFISTSSEHGVRVEQFGADGESKLFTLRGPKVVLKLAAHHMLLFRDLEAQVDDSTETQAEVAAQVSTTLEGSYEIQVFERERLVSRFTVRDAVISVGSDS
jgi:hypothetical protein